MELLNRYLHAVRFWLPKPQQEDIVAELGEDGQDEAAAAKFEAEVFEEAGGWYCLLHSVY